MECPREVTRSSRAGGGTADRPGRGITRGGPSARQPIRVGRYDELATQELLKTVRDAGVVGAGGAGFPTYKKLEASVSHVIANGAECEPLLQKDRESMLRQPRRLLPRSGHDAATDRARPASPSRSSTRTRTS